MKSFEDLNLTPDLPSIMDAHISGTHGALSDGCKSFCPKIIVEAIDPFSPDAKRDIICIVVDQDFNDSEKKHGIMRQIGEMFYKNGKLPLSVSLASEAWLSNNQENIAPSQADDRRECIVISALGIDKSTDMQLMPFRRDKQQNIIEGAFVKYSGGEVKSALLESFYHGFWEAYEEVENKRKGRR